MPTVDTTYAPGGGVTTRATRTALDLGPVPDFWGDLDLMKRQLTPRATEQARALRQPTFTPNEQAPRRDFQREFQEEYEPTFATMIGQGPQSAGVAYQNWVPGMTFSPLNAPVATGYARRR